MHFVQVLCQGGVQNNSIMFGAGASTQWTYVSYPHMQYEILRSALKTTVGCCICSEWSRFGTAIVPTQGRLAGHRIFRKRGLFNGTRLDINPHQKTHLAEQSEHGRVVASGNRGIIVRDICWCQPISSLRGRERGTNVAVALASNRNTVRFYDGYSQFFFYTKSPK